MRSSSLTQSFNNAIEGFIYVLKTQKNMRLHFLFGAFFLIFGIYVNLSRVEILILSCTIAFVLLAEMINTIVEMTVDLIVNAFHPVARIIKDVAAGAVLVASINAVIVGYLLFFRPILAHQIDAGIARIQDSPWHVTFISLILVIFLVVTGKLLFHKGTPLRGGMPSGHAALAFSIWTITAFVTRSELVVFLVFWMAAAVAQSRVGKGIHNVWEVLFGSVLGVLITVLIFQLLG